MSSDKHAWKAASRSHLLCSKRVLPWPLRSSRRRLLMNTELLEPRMLLSSVVGVDISDVSAADPLSAGSADQWVPYVPSAEQTKMQAQSVAEMPV